MPFSITISRWRGAVAGIMLQAMGMTEIPHTTLCGVDRDGLCLAINITNEHCR